MPVNKSKAQKSSYDDLQRFLGSRLINIFFASAFVGLGLSLVEIGLGFILQLLLSTLGLVSLENSPAFLRELKLEDQHVYAVVSVIILLRGFFTWQQSYLKMSSVTLFRYRFRKLISSWAFLSKKSNSSEVSNLLNEVVFASSKVYSSVQNLMLTGCTALVLFIALVYINLKLTAIVTVIALIIYPYIRYINKYAKQSGNETKRLWQNIQKGLNRGIKNILLIRIYGQQKSENRKIHEMMEDQYQVCLRYFKKASTVVALPQTFGFFVILLISYVSVIFFSEEKGNILTYFYLSMRFTQNLSSLTAIKSDLSFNYPQFQFLKDWFHNRDKAEQEVENINLPHPKVENISSIGFSIKDLTFKHDEQAHYLFNKLSLSITPLSSLGIIGVSGSGKSTLISLIIGEVTPNMGVIEAQFIGTDSSISSLSVLDCKKELRKHIGYVGPESFIIDGTIEENLQYGIGETLPKSDIDKALKTAECHFIRELEGGVQHKITEQGEGLSAGQKQRLSLARALLRKPKILILDEATSNLDNETEKLIIKNIADLKHNLTLIIISHKKSLLSLCDQTLELSPNEPAVLKEI